MQRKTDPTFTFIPDSVHPAADGQAIMAVAIINDLTPERRSVSRIVAARPKGRQVERQRPRRHG
jgi:hypothetical protein